MSQIPRRTPRRRLERKTSGHPGDASAQIDGQGQGAQPGGAAGEAARPEDDLSLQSAEKDHTLREGAGRRWRHAPRPPAVKASYAPDTSKLLVWGALFLVAVVIAGVFFLFKDRKPIEMEAAAYVKANSGPVAPVAPVPAASPAKSAPKGPDPAGKPAPSFNVNNPANRACFHAFLRFMHWAYGEGVESSGEVLSEKFQNEVSLSAVDDPDVREIHAQSLSFFRLGKERPMRLLLSSHMTADGPHGQARYEGDGTIGQLNQINQRIGELTSKARPRYGVPEFVKSPPPEGGERPRLHLDTEPGQPTDGPPGTESRAPAGGPPGQAPGSGSPPQERGGPPEPNKPME